MNEPIAGIDLGTTNSSIAFLEDGKPRIVEIDGQPTMPTMPSCVSVDDDGNILVGRAALNQLLAKPDDTVLSVKRAIGSDETFAVGGKSYRPEEISAFILRRLADEGRQHLGKPFKKAVITVPAYFNDEQRSATKNAAELAGLECVRLLNEPTAAALAYDPDAADGEKILVYDLGGGTFDVSLVVSSDGLVEVKASHGDTQLGGDDLDDLLVDMVVENSDILASRDSLDRVQLQRLRRACEAAKRTLSEKPTATIDEEYFLDDQHLEIEIDRHDFNERIAPLLEKTWTAVHASLHDGGIVPSALDKVLLVGGSTRIPLVADQMEARLGIAPRFDVDPDLIVTLGAAIQGGIVAGEKVDAILVDISAHTFSTGVIHGYDNLRCVPIIKRGTPLPCAKTDLFYTGFPGQESVRVEAYQGESEFPEENSLLGEFMIEGLDKKADENPILCEFALDLSGMLTVTATEKNTGLAKAVTIDTGGVRQTLDLEAAREKMAAMFDDDDSDIIDVETAPADDKTDPIVARAEKVLAGTDVGDEDRAEIEALVKQIDEEKKNAAPDRAATVEKLDDILFYIE